MTINDYIKTLKSEDELDPTCETCVRVFYPRLERGAKLSDIKHPGHKASSKCESGKNSHCSCDWCF